MAEQDNRISVSDDEMYAYLTVYPGDTAKTLSEDAVLAAINEAGIAFGIRHEELKADLQAAAKEASQSEKPRRVLVAEGQPPQPAAPERFSPSEELTLPREHRDTAKKLFRQAGAPRARRTVEEQVEVRKKVPRKGLFGLGRGKDEWQTVTETRERELTGKVPLKIRDARIVSRDATVGRISPAGTGTPGRNVKNARILPKKPADPWVYVGDYVRREGRTLIAEASGFLRIGPNWVDLVPYEAQDLQLTFSEDMADCLLTYRPGEDTSNRPAPETIIAAAKNKGYPAIALKSSAEIEELLDQAVYGGTALEKVSISTRLDTFIDIEISNDRSKAFLHVIKGRGGGRVLELRDVGKAVQRSAIQGIDREKLKTDLNEFRRSAELELRSYLLAEGTPPTQGPDPAVDFSLRDLPEAEQNRMIAMLKEQPELAGEHSGMDEFPPDSIETIAPVEADQHILTIAPGVPGKPGVDVFGEEIPGLPGPEPELHLFGALTRKADFVLATENGVVDRRRQEGHIYLRVRPNSDVAARVLVAKDQLSAQLVLTPHRGTGRRLTRETIDQVLKDKSVLEGVREEAIKEALAADEHGVRVTTKPSSDADGDASSATTESAAATSAAATSAARSASEGSDGTGSKPESISFLIARGKIATSDGRPAVQFFVNIPGAGARTDRASARTRASEQTQSPQKEGTSGEAEVSAAVSRGQPIAAVFRETAKGYSRGVDGDEIEPVHESANILHPGANVDSHEEPDGAMLLFSAADGRLQIDDTTVQVVTSRKIQGDVDLNTGNVKFPSSVDISGNVRNGFAVVADGDVRVGDTVEAALVSSEGDLTINGGVKGGGKAVLRAKGNMTASFIDRSRVFSVGTLSVDTGTHQCSVKCNDRIICRGTRSRIVGGEIKTRKGLEVQDLGSQKGTRTKVSFGQDYVIEHSIEELERKLAKGQQKLVQIDKTMAESSGPAVTRAQREKVTLLKRIERYSVQLFTLREKFEEHAESEIVVRGTLFPGVVFESHGRSREIQEPEKNVRLTFDLQTGKLVSSRLG